MSNRTFLKLIQTKIVVPVTLDLCSKHVTFDVQSISAQCFRGVSFLDQGIKQWTMSKASWGALDVQHSGCSVPSALGKAQKTTAQTVEITSDSIQTPPCAEEISGQNDTESLNCQEAQVFVLTWLPLCGQNKT